jgi:hypothetical protein
LIRKKPEEIDTYFGCSELVVRKYSAHWYKVAKQPYKVQAERKGESEQCKFFARTSRKHQAVIAVCFKLISFLAYCLTLKMETTCSLET